MTALDVRDLAVAYDTSRGRVVAVDGLDLRIEPGEAVALVGETGSGKTTAALTSIGLLPRGAVRLRGTVALGGQDITGWSPRRLQGILGRSVGLIPQDPTASLDPLKTVGWQIGEVLRIHGERDRAVVAREVATLLERVGLADSARIARAYPHELSGGQRQRVLIAGAIALRPGLLVADESTSALDVTVQRRVLDLLDDLRREDGSGILFVTHDLAVAAERADRVVVLEGGRVQDTGPVRVVLGGSASAYTRKLVSNAPALQAPRFREVPAASDEPPVIAVDGLVKHFPGRQGHDARDRRRVGLGQVDGRAHHAGSGDVDGGIRRGRRHRRRGPARARAPVVPAPGPARLPEPLRVSQPVAQHPRHRRRAAPPLRPRVVG